MGMCNIHSVLHNVLCRLLHASAVMRDARHDVVPAGVQSVQVVKGCHNCAVGMPVVWAQPSAMLCRMAYLPIIGWTFTYAAP